MLRAISIQNLVLFKQSDIAFTEGLNVLTGETGAGKSLLLDALGLVLGGRADATLVRSGASHAHVVAEFALNKNHAAHELLEEQGIEMGDVLMLRRSLSADGRSKAFVNDVGVTLATLRQLGESLIEIHGQHDSRGLLDMRTHRDVLDDAAGNTALRTATAEAFRAWKTALHTLETLTASIAQSEREEAYLRHMHAELKQLAPKEGEETELQQQRLNAQAMHKAREAIASMQEAMSGKASPRLQLSQAERALQRAGLPEAMQQKLTDGFTRAISEVMEIEAQLEELAGSGTHDERSVAQQEERLFALRDAARKYRVSVDGLEALWHETDAKLQTLSNQQHLLGGAEKQCVATKAAYTSLAQQLHEARAAYAPKLCKAIEKELAALKMSATQLRVQQTALPEAAWGEAGCEQVQFEVATNKGEAFGGLQKVASGGELSRLLLAMKVVLREGEACCSIFDEIDAGTGGAVAEAIGLRLKKLSAQTQVLVVTHLPQIAALASHHLKIEKTSGRNETITSITALNATQREEELARMMSGAEISLEARKAAQKLLKVAGA